jgi:hypothetical protein
MRTWLYERNECPNHGGIADEHKSINEITSQNTKIIESYVKITHQVHENMRGKYPSTS